MIAQTIMLTLAFIAVAQTVQAADPKLDLGIPMSSFTSSSPSDASIATSVFLKRVLEGTGVNYAGKVYDQDLDLADAIQTDTSDVVIINSGLYLDGEKFLNLRPLLVSTRTDAPTETLVLIAAKDRPLSELKGSSLLIDNSARGETPERWISDHLLRSGTGEIARDFFSTVKNVSSASRAVIPVYFGKADSAIVSAAGFETMRQHNPEIYKRLYVVCRSKELARTIVCVRTNYTDYRPNKITETLTNIHKSEDGQRFLERIGTSRFLPFKEEYLLFNREMQNRLESELRKKGNGE